MESRRHLEYEVVQRRKRGESKRGIARALDIDRKTVRRILKRARKRGEDGESALEREGISVPTPKGSKLDPYKEQISAWLDEYPDLTAQRVHEKLQELGVDVGYSIVRLAVKPIRAQKQAPKKKAAIEVITPPGQQCQFDWSPYTIATGEVVQLFSNILSWSRGHFFAAEDNTRQTTTMRDLQASFEDWDGVPHEGVTDSMPGVVDRWELDRPVLNVRFVDFAAYYGIILHIAPRGRGDYKGKVERPFWFAELNFLGGRTFHSLQQLREALEWWVREKAMRQPHPVTKRPRWEMLAEERPYLQPLPAHPYDTRDVVVRVVDAYGFVSHETNRYRLPDKYVGERIFICVGAERLEFFDRTVHRITDHERLPDGAGGKAGEGKRKQRYDQGLLADRLTQWGPEAEAFVRLLRDQQRYAGAHMARLIGLQRAWAADDIVAAIRHALDYRAGDARSVERILTARFSPLKPADQIADTTRRQVRRLMGDNPVVQRPLDQYETLRCGDAWPSQERNGHDKENDA